MCSSDLASACETPSKQGLSDDSGESAQTDADGCCAAFCAGSAPLFAPLFSSSISDAAETAPPVVNSAPPAITPPAPRQYIVYFGFNRANLTAAARQTVREAADTAMHDGFVAIRVTGHTDTVGSAKYNMLLSKRREIGRAHV